MRKLRLYFDTSVFGGIYDVEFQKETEKLFEMVKNDEITCVYSDLCEFELENAPDKVKEHFLSLNKNQTEYAEITEEINQLAEEYIKEKVVGETSIDDCRHIACATINKVDYLVSWNFKHIVNVFRIRGYNAINIKNGHIQLDIRSPKEIIRNE
ncbi:MAG: type II toxin-antitoxin system VapC family toxin [Flavobacteriia bacterium]|nr:PIN domain-containing protein [Flavobacteriaceae bacterium]NCT08477.1 type II toxin-antitoxin system VapC family toxin [Flavobacteriia bacterium]OIP48056.1 MAG: PIN domain protein [Flavobacteriaceae bacterium CG2_30_31_66]PIV95441.1 MAG: PIN domain protein [Flavobacteriaceae bacterium CG17_big_fil_post_rev_8_21_14_2_50_31_13]PIX11530.1 MAG: PIN domain protein [Flavobacteriaceae bacterium CG_4_8_14_3_um_filter_31_8]PIY14147.1 MAG: PIN domain protein [Flavobacteriaceae bacterium CG_4_10_14_3_